MQVEFKQQQQKWKPSHARSRVNSNENGPSELKPQWPKRLKDRLKKKKKDWIDLFLAALGLHSYASFL